MAAPYAGRVAYQTKSALVVGSGVIGLCSAFRLARRGFFVTQFDPSPAQGATRAAAGMIAPSAEILPGELDSYELQRGALSAWRDLSRELGVVTSNEVPLHETGTLVIGWDASDRRMVEQYASVAAEFGVTPQRVTRSSDEAMFEGISGRIEEGLFIAGDAWIDPDLAVTLLQKANDSLGVQRVLEEVLEVESSLDAVVAVTASKRYQATAGILATGAAPLPQGARASGEHVVRPVRGMTARVQGLDRSSQPTIRAFVRGRTFYMVSRPGGYCVLGATSEERSEPVVEVGELQRLLRDSLDVVPSLESSSLIETRLGLRPANIDLEPFFEVLAGERWAWVSGHYRHGVTLAPLASLEVLRFCESVA